ncbi:MAG: hypothetical protein WAL27_09940, partial [Cellulosimicrobium cellulans]
MTPDFQKQSSAGSLHAPSGTAADNTGCDAPDKKKCQLPTTYLHSYTDRMIMPLFFGVIASSALILGAVIGVRFELPKRLLAILLAFAAGSLITA